MDFRDKAIKLYKEGKSIDEISNEIGFDIDADFVEEWAKEDTIKEGKYIVWKLDGEQRQEKDYVRKVKINKRLKQKLEEILEILPDDIDLKKKLVYTNINLGNVDEARKIGYELLEIVQTNDVLNALAIIEEMSENYTKSAEFIRKMLENDPNNQAWKSKLERVEEKSQKKLKQEKLDLYKQIADNKKRIEDLTTEEMQVHVLRGKNYDIKKIRREKKKQAYENIKILAMQILEKYPEEIVAKEKLIEALYIIGEKEEAEMTALELLQYHKNDEIALWYLADIERDRGNLQGERKYLEEIIDNSALGSQIKVSQRLEKVLRLIKKEEKEQEKRKIIEDSYDEVTREEFIEKVYTEFLEGKINLKNINRKIQEAKKYPNFTESLIQLLEIKSKITGELQDKIDGLESYLKLQEDRENSGNGNIISSEDKDILEKEILLTKQQKEKEEAFENHLRKEELKKEFNETNGQRQYSKDVISKLSKGKITKEDLPQIVARLEQFTDRGKSIFLITKLYEILYGKEEAYKKLEKYTAISDLTDIEKKQIEKMQNILENNEEDIGKTKVIKELYLKKQKESKQKYKKQIDKERIIAFLKENKTVKEIYDLLATNNEHISKIAIARIRKYYLKENEQLRTENIKLEEYAYNLLQSGYRVKDVYEILENDIPITRLQEFEKRIKEEKERG